MLRMPTGSDPGTQSLLVTVTSSQGTDGGMNRWWWVAQVTRPDLLLLVISSIGWGAGLREPGWGVLSQVRLPDHSGAPDRAPGSSDLDPQDTLGLDARSPGGALPMTASALERELTYSLQTRPRVAALTPLETQVQPQTPPTGTSLKILRSSKSMNPQRPPNNLGPLGDPWTLPVGN